MKTYISNSMIKDLEKCISIKKTKNRFGLQSRSYFIDKEKLEKLDWCGLDFEKTYLENYKNNLAEKFFDSIIQLFQGNNKLCELLNIKCGDSITDGIIKYFKKQ